MSLKKFYPVYLSQYRLILNTFKIFFVGKSQAYKLTGGSVVRSMEEQGANETSLQFFTKLGLMVHLNLAGGRALLSEEMDGFFTSLSRVQVLPGLLYTKYLINIYENGFAAAHQFCDFSSSFRW